MWIIQDQHGNEDAEWLNEVEVDEPGEVGHSWSDPATPNGHVTIKSVKTWIQGLW